MPGFALRVLPVAVTLWLAACGAGGNNNIFDLDGAGGGGDDSTALRVSVESTALRAAAIGRLALTGAANASRGPGCGLQS